MLKAAHPQRIKGQKSARATELRPRAFCKKEKENGPEALCFRSASLVEISGIEPLTS